MSGGEGSAALAAWLAARGVDAELVAPGAEMPTVERAAAALGVAPAEIVKSILFQHKKDRGRLCLAVAPGDVQVDRRKVADALGQTRLKLASPDAALEATGYAVGGIPPVGHRSHLPVVVDERVLAHPVVFGGGGDEHHMLRIAPAAIVALTAAVVADVAADPAAAGEDAGDAG